MWKLSWTRKLFPGPGPIMRKLLTNVNDEWPFWRTGILQLDSRERNVVAQLVALLLVRGPVNLPLVQKRLVSYGNASSTSASRCYSFDSFRPQVGNQMVGEGVTFLPRHESPKRERRIVGAIRRRNLRSTLENQLDALEQRLRDQRLEVAPNVPDS